MEHRPDRLESSPDNPPTDAPADLHRCNVSLPAWPTDRPCMLGAGHEGDHADARGPFTTDAAMNLHQLIADAAVTITAQAPQLAREAVLRGTVSMQVQGLENRAQRRQQGKQAKARDARKRR